MGFLKFLQREKKKDELSELDLPPAPPPLEGFDENMPELPDFPDFDEQKTSPESDTDIPDIGKENIQDISILPEIEETSLPSMPTISAPPPTPEPMPPLFQPTLEPDRGEVTLEKPQYAPQFTYQKTDKRPFIQEKKVLREVPSAKTIYVRIDRFKATLGNINILRSDLRKSEEALIKLENIKNEKDKSFDKVKSLLDDTQKKLIFVDKTLFKGE